MVAAKGLPHRRREYIIIKHGTSFYYARAHNADPDTYVIMAKVGEKEGREIVNKANSQSQMNRDIDKIYEVADKFMDNWDGKDEKE